ncbi:MAG TPA: hypothetical protein VN372_14380 [Methanospirillum sp.]|nr:hypothetical protein [Methanospirillum sp.]
MIAHMGHSSFISALFVILTLAIIIPGVSAGFISNVSSGEERNLTPLNMTYAGDRFSIHFPEEWLAMDLKSFMTDESSPGDNLSDKARTSIEEAIMVLPDISSPEGVAVYVYNLSTFGIIGPANKKTADLIISGQIKESKGEKSTYIGETQINGRKGYEYLLYLDNTTPNMPTGRSRFVSDKQYMYGILSLFPDEEADTGIMQEIEESIQIL